MSFFFKALLSGQPLDTDTIKVYKSGTTDLLTGLTDLDGVALANPFTVADAGGVGEWGFVVPNESPFDVYWEESATYIGKNEYEPIKPLVATKDAAYTIKAEDNMILADGSLNPVPITLPSAVDLSGNDFVVKCIDDTNTVSVTADGAETIDGSASIQIYKHETLTLRSDGENWWLI